MSAKPKIIIEETKYRGKKGFYVIVKARNGRVLMTSEILSSKRRARENAIATEDAMRHGQFINFK